MIGLNIIRRALSCVIMALMGIMTTFAQDTREVTINSGGASEAGFSLSPSCSAYTYSNDAISSAKMLSLSKGDYTISVPEGVTVVGASFYACVDNNADNKGGLTKFNGESCSYLFVNRKSSTFTTVSFVNQMITSNVAFTLSYNSGVAITLTVTGENNYSSEGGTGDSGSSDEGDTDDTGSTGGGGSESGDDDPSTESGSTPSYDSTDPMEGTPDVGTVIDNPLVVIAQDAWFESAFIEWQLISNAANYNVYIKSEGGQYRRINKNLVRNYGTFGRADMVGLKAGKYMFKVVATDGSGSELSWGVESQWLNVESYDRGGFAHKDGVAVGAYNNDGTLKADAQVIYVTDDNFDTVKGTILAGKTASEFVGVGNILKALEKGLHTDPLCIRIVGTITSCSQLYGDAGALQLKGKNNTIPVNVTIEGIGRDATLKSFGIVVVKANNVEIRNIGFNGFADDGISIKESVKLWVHNNDIFYGAPGSAADQSKGDGSLDVKDDSQYCTFSYNHFLDSGKSSLCGMKSESGENFICYHHNWFNHSDSRHPRVRTMTVHVYNNYYDGVAKYGIGATTGSNVFVESNFFRNTNRPMMSSLQGTDATGDGTFSGENGGMIKAFGNVMTETGKNYSFIAANTPADKSAPVTSVSATSFDAYYASSRDEQVPSSYVALKGGTAYNNFDTDKTKMHDYVVDNALDVPYIVMSKAGRMQGGDYHWLFENSTDDYDYDVQNDMKSTLTSYKTSLVEVGAFTKVSVVDVQYQNATFFADVNGNGTFATIQCHGYLKYPSTQPSAEGMTFIGWNIPQGYSLSKDIEVYPIFSDGKSSITPPTVQPETTVVREWYFDSWSDETQSKVSSDASWVKDSSTERYDITLGERASLGLEETTLLEFVNKVRISFDSNKGLYLQGSFVVYVPVEEGELISVTFSNTGSSNGSRDLIINGEVVASSDNTSSKTAVYVVPSGVSELEITGSAGLNYYSIKCEKISEINGIAVDKKDSRVIREENYTLSGVRSTGIHKGVNIIKKYMSDGTIVSEKVLVR